MSADAEDKTVRLAIVAPTFDNAGTLRSVLDGVGVYACPVIAVNDGSTDGTADVLAGWTSVEDGRHVVAHALNRGKAEALRSGFERAAAIGCTHALTIDTDGQHDPADAAALIALCQAHPRAIILGCRPMNDPAYPRKSRWGRLASNALVNLIGGVRVGDSQCGLRAYPIELVRVLGAKTSRYAFETEVLSRAGWAAVEIVETPIRCIYSPPGQRVTHFRPLGDSLSAVWMHIGMGLRSMLPWPLPKWGNANADNAGGTILERCVRWMNPLRTWRRATVDRAERERVAASVGWGVFVATQPAFGLKTVLCLLFAKWFRLQPLVVLATSSLATPPMGVALWILSIATGHLLFHGRLPAMHDYAWRSLGNWATVRALAAEWITGALICGTILGLAAYAIVRGLMRRIPLRQRLGDVSATV